MFSVFTIKTADANCFLHLYFSAYHAKENQKPVVNLCGGRVTVSLGHYTLEQKTELFFCFPLYKLRRIGSNQYNEERVKHKSIDQEWDFP